MSHQRKILALDGGGIRGMISVEVLARIEALLRAMSGLPDLVVADWFDLIAGTSTGAVTAALLATGHSVDDVRRFYKEDSAALFKPADFKDRLRHRYTAEVFTQRLKQEFGAETTLGTERLRTLLMLVLRNVSTDSPWFLTNHPNAVFNDRALPTCNLDLPLWQLIRASAAAPTYFRPEEITLGDETFVFSDGALTGFNNPAFKAFLIATVEPYGLSWPAERDRLLVVSVGTGTGSLANRSLRPDRMHLLYHAETLPQALLSATKYQQDLLCRVFGDCLVGDPLDLEVGDLIGTRGPAEPKLFTYLRYDVALTPEGLSSIGCEHLPPEQLVALDNAANLDALREVGSAVAEHRVCEVHFEAFLSDGRGACDNVSSGSHTGAGRSGGSAQDEGSPDDGTPADENTSDSDF